MDSRPFLCDVCGDNFRNKWALKDHFQRHHFVCNVCGEGKFSGSGAFREHFERYHSGQKYPCKTCKREFSSSRQLLDHTRHVHGKKIKCECCDKSFSKQANLNKHLKKDKIAAVPDVPKDDQNEHLDKIDTVPDVPKDDQNEHVDELVCEDCNNIYLSKKSLQSHRNSVHKQENVKCTACLKNFLFKVCRILG